MPATARRLRKGPKLEHGTQPDPHSTENILRLVTPPSKEKRDALPEIRDLAKTIEGRRLELEEDDVLTCSGEDANAVCTGKVKTPEGDIVNIYIWEDYVIKWLPKYMESMAKCAEWLQKNGNPVGEIDFDKDCVEGVRCEDATSGSGDPVYLVKPDCRGGNLTYTEAMTALTTLATCVEGNLNGSICDSPETQALIIIVIACAALAVVCGAACYKCCECEPTGGTLSPSM